MKDATKPQFKKLLEFTIKNNHFIFHNQLYEQADGVAMSSPLGHNFANIFMCALEQNFLSNCRGFPYTLRDLRTPSQHSFSSFIHSLTIHTQLTHVMYE